ncbi:hypothetical protein GCM10009838_20870 [Catenulispora subtropica]|uniref:Uncharacterized protein n=2 Tax=Catenulispora subtropica TaxID=450798 RepID=A0ABN2R4M9_9ACTN
MALLWRSHARKRLVHWPESVDERLEILVRQVIAEGGDTSAAQVLGALVALCPTDPEKVTQLVKEYRQLHEEEFRTQIDPVGLPELRRRGPRRKPRD